VGIPVSPGDRPVTLQVGPGWPVGTTVEACFGDGPPTIAVVSADGRLTLPIPSDAPIRPVVQNAGSLVFRDGRGRDRGAVARPGSHFFADDVGQFDQVEEVFAGCGASLLLRATTLADVGGFDERFFMYYEDTDLSWRARLGGWKVIYAPDALVRHRHRGSSAAWSGRFVYYTERNRLFMLLKLAPLDRALVQLGRAFLAAGRASLAAVRRAARGQNPAAAYAGPRWAALASLAVQLPGLLRSRAQIQTQRRVKQSEIDRWLT
jgi:GT2 family glycosyltransferase